MHGQHWAAFWIGWQLGVHKIDKSITYATHRQSLNDFVTVAVIAAIYALFYFDARLL
jgi:preprotein translocase subunit SecE